jgi:hypothetical protein
MPRGALDAFLLNGLTVGMKAGGQAFLDEVLSALGDKQLEAIKATADKLLKSRAQTVIDSESK